MNTFNKLAASQVTESEKRIALLKAVVLGQTERDVTNDRAETEALPQDSQWTYFGGSNTTLNLLAITNLYGLTILLPSGTPVGTVQPVDVWMSTTKQL